jgi:spore coat polysaccharide biosynthesis protein SpsF (cytidylyltransferase family)
MAKVVLIIQARMSSTRLPGKSMMPLAEKIAKK